jgi:muramoyltetrapeptide carboxypeptidase LdcA involved in peptidoglycan recycling
MLASKEADAYTSPRKKLLRFFMRSRDGWKAKCLASKQRCKRLGNQVRAVETSRERWRTLAQEREQRIVELEQAVAELKRSTS